MLMNSLNQRTLYNVIRSNGEIIDLMVAFLFQIAKLLPSPKDINLFNMHRACYINKKRNTHCVHTILKYSHKKKKMH